MGTPDTRTEAPSGDRWPSRCTCHRRWSSSITSPDRPPAVISRRAASAWRSGATPPKRASTAPSPPPQRQSRASGSSGARASASTVSASVAASVVPPAAVTVPAGTGCSRSDSSTISPRVPNEPVKSLARSYPATFLITFPPARATVPSGNATRMPTTRSRAEPKRPRRGPESLVATIPPMVAPPGSGGSRASICPAAAERLLRPCERHAGLDHRRQVAGVVLDDPVEAVRGQHRRRARRRRCPADLRAAAREAHRLVTLGRGTEKARRRLGGTGLHQRRSASPASSSGWRR